MFDRKGRDAVGRFGSGTGSRARSKVGPGLRVESLEGRQLMTASLAPIPSVTVEAGKGYQVPVNALTTTNADPQTYTVTTDSPTGGAAATIATGNFLTVNVSHVSGGANDPAFSGTMVFQDFTDLTPNSASKIEALANGTATGLEPGIPTGTDYYAGKSIHRIVQFTGTAATSTTPATTGSNAEVVQGGSLDGAGSGQVYATTYATEISTQLVYNGTGQLALARGQATTTNDAQFFITDGSPRVLDGNYTIFGQLVSGKAILDDLARVQVEDNGSGEISKPVGATTINSVVVSSTNPGGVIHVNATSSTAGTQTNVTVTAKDTVDGTTTSQTFPVFTVAARTTAVLGVEMSPPRINPVPTPQTLSVGQNTTIQLSADNIAGGTLTYTVQGAVSGSAFTSVANATATVDPTTGLVSVTPTPGYIGPINLVVGVRDQDNRAGGTSLEVPANYSLQTVTINVAAPVSTGTTRFLIDGNADNASAGTLVVTPLPRTDGGTNTIAITQSNGNVMVTVNGVVDATEPSVANVDRIIVYGSKASDKVTIDPSLSMEVSLDGGRGGKNSLTAGGGPTTETGWYGKSNKLVQGTSVNYQFGRAGRVTFVKGTGTSNVIFSGVPGHPTNNGAKERKFPTQPTGTFFTFKGTKLVKTADKFSSVHTTITATSSSATKTTTTTKGSTTTIVKPNKVTATMASTTATKTSAVK